MKIRKWLFNIFKLICALAIIYFLFMILMHQLAHHFENPIKPE